MGMVTISIQIDEDLKNKAEALLYELGLDMETAINMLLRQCVREQAIPFRIGKYNEHPDELPSNSELTLKAEIAELLVNSQLSKEIIKKSLYELYGDPSLKTVLKILQPLGKTLAIVDIAKENDDE